ncbi:MULTISPECIES: IclR family transcriptional regulator [unclassified Chelatococcus]|uniref:IclR family transcriptional regulator n=1 Tax=unclassified Chelatococcus TaxID=2638111 RepID=UPI001BD16262|nr:IclR family transcriptional regulator [Chelatococcus sp.]MBS7698881.1 IclR family transcriptional regulator [Chelatococcus sp. YT9]MBX3559543.1 IclR family transcriptional regulator [Chelatococcus sp.]
MSNGTQRSTGIGRTIDILEYLNRKRSPVGIGDLARALNAPRSSIYSIVGRLAEAEILQLDQDNNVFFGRAVYLYGDAYLASQPLVRLGRDEVIRLSRETGETTQLCMLVSAKYTVAFMHPGASLFRISSEVGVLVPIPWTASGRLLVGGMSDREILDLIPAEDYALPNGAAIDPAQFIQEVRQACAANMMETTGLSDPYTTCLASAVFDHVRMPAATICFMVPANTPHTRKQELLQHLRQSADKVSQSLLGSYR